MKGMPHWGRDRKALLDCPFFAGPQTLHSGQDLGTSEETVLSAGSMVLSINPQQLLVSISKEWDSLILWTSLLAPVSRDLDG